MISKSHAKLRRRFAHIERQVFSYLADRAAGLEYAATVTLNTSRTKKKQQGFVLNVFRHKSNGQPGGKNISRRPFLIFIIRLARKFSFIVKKISERVASRAAKVEDKATRLLTGVDFSMPLLGSMAVEEMFFNGIPYNMAPLNPALPALGREGKVTLLIPSLQNSSFFGGTSTALILAGRLAEKTDKPLRIVETLSPGGKEGLTAFFSNSGISIRASDVELIDVSSRQYNVYGYLDIHPDDIFMASAWWDARLLSQLPLPRKFIYLIQDYEPIFYPNSDRYTLAENTYRTDDFIPLCNTELMYKFMSNKGYEYIEKNGFYFEPAVSYLSYGLSKEKKRAKKRMFLYGRPRVERNLFYCGLCAINQAFVSGGLNPSEWEIFMAGQDNMPNIRLSNGLVIENLGKMPMNKYIDFTRTVDLAISLMMAPHPNYPTLEFASVGASVVTTRYETKTDLSKYSKNIHMSDLSIDDVTNTIVKASKASYSERIKNLELNHINEDWEKALMDPLDKVIKSLNQPASR